MVEMVRNRIDQIKYFWGRFSMLMTSRMKTNNVLEDKCYLYPETINLSSRHTTVVSECTALSL